MVEYLALGHMDPIERRDKILIDSLLSYHVVFKSEDRNGKIRVIFNASFQVLVQAFR